MSTSANNKWKSKQIRNKQIDTVGVSFLKSLFSYLLSLLLCCIKFNLIWPTFINFLLKDCQAVLQYWPQVCLSVSAVLWGDHGLLAEAPLRSGGPCPAGLRGPRDLVLQTEGSRDGAAAVVRHLQASRWVPAWTTPLVQAEWTHQSSSLHLFLFSRECTMSSAPLSFTDPSLSWAPSAPLADLHELPASARTAEGLHHVPGVWPVQAAKLHTSVMQIHAKWMILKYLLTLMNHTMQWW